MTTDPIEEAGLRITNDRRGPWLVVSARGRIDRVTAPHLGGAFARVTGGEPVALDLRGAEVADESGSVLLLNAMRRLHARQRELIVVCPQPSLREALDRSGLARRFELLGDVDAVPDLSLRPSPSDTVRVVGERRPRASTSAHRAALLADATLAIERRYAEHDLSLGDIAREIATSKRQLQRVFAEVAGSAFRDEVAAVRMQHGADMLQNTDLPVATIARRVGYRHSAQFAKAFRRHHDLGPSALRRARRRAERRRREATGAARVETALAASP